MRTARQKISGSLPTILPTVRVKANVTLTPCVPLIPMVLIPTRKNKSGTRRRWRA